MIRVGGLADVEAESDLRTGEQEARGCLGCCHRVSIANVTRGRNSHPLSPARLVGSYDPLANCRWVVQHGHVTATVTERICSRLRIRQDLPEPDGRRALRQAAGLTQEEVAGAIGVTRQAVAQWEAGVRTPRGRLLDAYVDVLRTLREAT
ncbi:helix-turn-helix transcriptional regulator [Streptomyces bobili]|uniref:helix-turn-helix domain-containing protein n=1 Tax=Streptomyces bobili TaxID=67280 RepID=UPI0033A259A1